MYPQFVAYATDLNRGRDGSKVQAKSGFMHHGLIGQPIIEIIGEDTSGWVEPTGSPSKTYSLSQMTNTISNASSVWPLLFVNHCFFVGRVKVIYNVTPRSVFKEQRKADTNTSEGSQKHRATWRCAVSSCSSFLSEMVGESQLMCFSSMPWGKRATTPRRSHASGPRLWDVG